MDHRQVIGRAEIAERVSADPVLSEFVAPFPDLLGGEADFGAGFQRMASSMTGTKMTGAIQFTIREAEAVRRWSLLLSPRKCEAVDAGVDNPHLEVLTDAATWSQIASGRLAPLEAMGLGTVRVRGDLRLARLLARGLHKHRRSAGPTGREEESDG